MNRLLGVLLFVVGVLFAPALFWVLGPMVFWPLSRKYLAPDDARIKYFKNIFVMNMILVVGGSLLVGLLFLIGVPDAFYYLAVPYSIGVLLLLSAIVILFVGRGLKADP